MPFTVGGGVREVEDFRTLLLSGADKVSINTGAVENPELIDRAAGACRGSGPRSKAKPPHRCLVEGA